MKLHSYKIMLSLLMGFLLIAQTSVASAASISWRSYSSSVFSAAKAQHKLVLLYIESSSCHWCAKMNEETFTSSEVANLVNQKFIPVSVDMMMEPSVSRTYRTRGTPTFVILDANKNEVSRLVGYQSPSEFKSYLRGF